MTTQTEKEKGKGVWIDGIMKVNEQRKGEIAYALLKLFLQRERFRINGLSGYIAEASQKTQVPLPEMRAFVATILPEVLGDCLPESQKLVMESFKFKMEIMLMGTDLTTKEIVLPTLSVEQINQLAYIILKEYVCRDAGRMDGLSAKIGEISPKVGIDVKELTDFAATLLTELVVEVIAPQVIKKIDKAKQHKEMVEQVHQDLAKARKEAKQWPKLR